MERKINNTLIILTEGDITEIAADAIVNAANTALQLGAGVAGAIRQKGGPVIQEECDRIGGTYVGGAVITSGGNLKAKHVIHAVGPRMGEGDEDRKLESATINSLKLADEHKLNSIAFPAISTGIFGYPLPRCAKIMLGAAKKYLDGSTSIQKVIFCLYGQNAYQEFQYALDDIL